MSPLKPEDATGVGPTEGEGDFELELKCRGCKFVYRQTFKHPPSQAQIKAFRLIGVMHEGRTGHEVGS